MDFETVTLHKIQSGTEGASFDLKGFEKGYHHFLIRAENRTVAAIDANIGDGDLFFANLVVFPECRRKGFGAAILKKFVAENSSRFNDIYCYVSVENKGAISFYKAAGFQVCASEFEAQGFDGKQHRCILWQKNL